MSAHISSETLEALFDSTRGLTGAELATLFGTRSFVLLLLEDTESLQFLHRVAQRTHTDGTASTPVRYWCGRDAQSISRLIETLQKFNITCAETLICQLSAKILTDSNV